MILHATSITDAFAQRVQASANLPAVWQKLGGRWQSLTWKELDSLVTNLAQLLAAQGIKTGTVVGHHSENRTAWLVLDLALHQLHAVHLPIHASYTPAQAVPLLSRGQAEFLIISPSLASAWQSALSNSSSSQLIAAICLDDAAQKIEPLNKPLNAHHHPSAASVPDSTALLLFTSGTSSLPRGVCLSSQALAANAIATQLAFAEGLSPEVANQRRRLTVLPLSHVYALVCDFYGTIIDGAQLALATSRQTWLSEAAEIQPTFLNAVPFFYDRLQAVVTEATGPSASPTDRTKKLQLLTGGKLIHCCVGGAAASSTLLQFFESCDVPLLAGYGLTENGPCISVTGPLHYRPGSVGKLVPGLQAKVSSQGEILVQSPSIMLGYLDDSAATAEALQDGWLHTGDLGHLDNDGYLYLDGRKTEMIVTSLGKNVWPTPIEQRILRDTAIRQVVVLGNDHPYLVALVVPAEAPSNHSSTTAIADDLQQRITAQLVDLPSHEQVRKIAVLPAPLQFEKGELSGKNEPCRSVISKIHADTIAALYQPR